jgi:transposase InsO family protein
VYVHDENHKCDGSVEHSKETVDLFGNSRRIILDQGAAFTSNDFQNYCKEENIEYVLITIGISRGNSQVERSKPHADSFVI